MFELVDNQPSNAVIKVIGVGGGGGNAVKHMIDSNVEGVEFICANTDAQALSDVVSKTILQLGGDITKGLGAGANPEIGRAAAMAEAQRCLSCGNCLACDNCWTFCPDNAVIKTAELARDGSHYLFDLDYCKGCGLCAHECPTGYIQMLPEEDEATQGGD